MTKEEKRAERKAVLSAKIKALKTEISKLRKLKRAEKKPLLKLNIELEMAVHQGQLKGYKNWLDQLENPLV